jgi:tetratricopeptide (TPR) repeat protein
LGFKVGIFPSSEGIERAEILMRLAHQIAHRNSPGEALVLTQEAAELFKKFGAPSSLVCRAYTGISFSLAGLHRTAEAAATLEKALDIARGSQDPFLDDLLRTQDQWFNETCNWSAALKCHEEAILFNEINGDQLWLARSYFNAASCLLSLKKFDDAISHYGFARSIFKQEKNLHDIALCDLWIGETWTQASNGWSALPPAHMSLDVFTMLKRQEMIVRSLLVIGKAYLLIDEFTKAEENLVEANALLTENPITDWSLLLEINEELEKSYQSLDKNEEANRLHAQIMTIQTNLEESGAA